MVTNYWEGGGVQNGRGVGKVLPLQKGGGGRKAMLKGGGTTYFEVILTQELEVLAILIGGT